MRVDPTYFAPLNIGDSRRVTATNGDDLPPANREEAAKQFEEELVRQFVDIMLSGVFEESLDGSSSVVNAAKESQKDTLVSQLSELLTNDGGLRLADSILRQWERTHGPADNSEQVKTSEPDIRDR